MPLDIVAPVVGLPVGPTTEARVRAQLGVDDAIDDASLQAAINAANFRAVEFRAVDEIVVAALATDPPPDPEVWEWPQDIALGVTMLAARLFRRRNSTEGVATFNDQGAVYVQRNDPDIAMLLRLGSHARPAVG